MAKTQMKLKRFKVTNFRSVEDSGWIETDDVSSLIGINESGKSNLLAPLWKLNPAKGGEIQPIADYPRTLFNTIREKEQKPIFIEAQFELSDELISRIKSLTKFKEKDLKLVQVSKDFGGLLYIEFPNAQPIRLTSRKELEDILKTAQTEINTLIPIESETEHKQKILTKITEAIEATNKLGQQITADDLDLIAKKFTTVTTEPTVETSLITPRYKQIKISLASLKTTITHAAPEDIDEVWNLVEAGMPKFVYYSNFGNLDSEIFLPHVIQNMTRTDLGSKEEAKARTLKVLFDFVKLKPKEILDMGQENPQANADQLAIISEKKRERDVLMQSASTYLTREFRNWWKQGDYRFRFSADGNHFRIWVSDDKRPEDIELEGRSTGLQWFLSFFLVFLVEAKDAHAGAILLLDEPGLTLHPLAQKDLAVFFDNLAKTNQLIFSTHSPFMIEADKLDRVKAVYLDANGRTAVTADLRTAATKSVREKSIFAAHAALGITVSDVILQGCQPVVVEGTSDQHYLSMMKTHLISQGILNPNREIVFVPAGGIKGIKAVAGILAAKDDALPFVLLDSDASGLKLAADLRKEMYVDQQERVILTQEITGMKHSEVEDILPATLLADVFSRSYRGKEEDFIEVLKANEPIIPQMESFAEKNGLSLALGWKVDLAKDVRRRIQNNPDALKNILNADNLVFKFFQTTGGTVKPAIIPAN